MRGASIDVVIFRFVKGLKQNTVILNGTKTIVNNQSGSITFGQQSGTELGKLFDVYIGIVSGKDSVYQNDLIGNITVKTDLTTSKKFILVRTFPSKIKQIDDLLLVHKDELISRRIRKFNENNWFECGALRNIQHIKQRKGTACIYVCTLTRNIIVASIGKVGLFGGNLLCIIPKEDINITSDDLASITALINSKRSEYVYSGRYKITHRQLRNILLPYEI